MADFSVKHITPKLGGERGARNRNGPTSSHDLVEQMEFLYVEVIEARYLSEVKPRTLPIVEITLGNYKSTTKDLPPYQSMDWKQVFAFDKSKGDVLSVTLKADNTEIGKQNFKIAADIPTRVIPEPTIAPQYYSMFNAETGIRMDLLMSVWFGTQADEVYSHAWFSDAYEVSASCVINTRPKIYLPPRLCYVRVTVVSGHDLIARDRNRTPSVYVKAVLGKVALKTKVASGSDPSWNQDLIFVASESLNDTVEFSLMDQIDDQHEECIGKLKKKLSEMTPLKLPGSASVTTCLIEPPSKVEPVGDKSWFSSKIKMKLATDQAYHVFDECIQYSSDYRAFVKALWPGLLGKLEIGILGATGLKLPRDDDKKKGIDSYVVAKYGNKWGRTRTVVNSTSPKWNEQHWFDVYEKCTVLTLGIYDNRNIANQNRTNDVPIGKVRIPLSKVQWNRLYTNSIPVFVLGSFGLKKVGEIQIAIRCVCVAQIYPFVMAPSSLMLPKAHYKSPLSPTQIEQLRAQAVQVNCMNLAKTEPPLRNEVVLDMLKPKNRSFSMRKTKVNYERVCRIFRKSLAYYDWFDTKVISTTDPVPKGIALGVIFFALFIPHWILWLFCWLIPVYIFAKCLWEAIKFVNREYLRNFLPIDKKPPILTLFDLNISKLNSYSLDELAEEFDTFPSSEFDMNVLKMRYDRLRKLTENVMVMLGDFASQGERFYVLINPSYDPITSGYFSLAIILFLLLIYFIPYYLWVSGFVFYWLKFPCVRNDLPTGFRNFFRRLPTNEELMP